MMRRGWFILLWAVFVACARPAPQTPAQRTLQHLREQVPAVRQPAVAERFAPESEHLVPVIGARPVGIARAAGLALPLAADGAFELSDSAGGARLTAKLLGADHVSATLVDGHAVYVGAWRGGDVVHRPSVEGTEDFVVLTPAVGASELVYSVRLEAGLAGLRLVSNQLEFVDAAGAPRLRVTSPYVVDAAGTRRDATLAVSGCAVDQDPRVPWDHPPVAPGATDCSVHVRWSADGLVPPVVVDPSWTTTGSPANDYELGGGMQLSPGRALFGALKKAEVYDHSTRTWSVVAAPTDSNLGRELFSMPDGTIVSAGGNGPSHQYNPDTGVWTTSSGAHCYPNGGCVVVEIDDTSRPLVSLGGKDCSSGTCAEQRGIWRYTLASNSWAKIGDLATARTEAVAAPIVGYEAIVCGGKTASGTAITSCETVFSDGSVDVYPSPAHSGLYGNALMRTMPNRKILLNYCEGNTSGTPILLEINVGWSSFTGTSTGYCQRSLAQLGKNSLVLVGGTTGGTPQTVSDLVNVSGASISTGPALSSLMYSAATATLSDGRVIATFQQHAEVLTSPVTCSAASDCLTGNCVDGYCCNSTCTDTCGRCNIAGSEGWCSPVPAGTAGKTSCSPYVCGGTSTSCTTACTSDAGCASGFQCANGVCVTAGSKGTTCTSQPNCGSGLTCTQNVCCDSTCQDGCDTCTRATGATADGTCTALPKGNAGLPGCGTYLCGGSSSCPSTCTIDGDCATTAYCDASHHCVAKIARGSTCTADNQCSTTHCVDSVCCDSTCSGACDACSTAAGAATNGTCAAVALGKPGAPTCTPYVCDGTGVACPSTCTNDNQCISGDYCDASNHCVPKLTTGTACTGNNQCASTFCSDSVCCDKACSGSCDACSVAKGATVDGTCVNISGAGAPSCTPYLCLGTGASCPTTCQTDGQCIGGDFCDASNHCVTKLTQGGACTGNNQCQNGLCVDGFCCDKACDGACDACSVAKGATTNGTCKVLSLGSAGAPACAPFVCDGAAVACPTSCTTDAQCVSADYCDSSHQCVPKKTGGTSCSANNQCSSTFCTDGVCCDKACGGGCEVCSAALGASANGTCTNLPANAAGSPSCTPYVCAGGQAACPTSCTADANCIAGDYCNASHQCVPKISGGGSCSGDSQCASTHCADGKCCNTACDGSCDVCAASAGATADGTCTIVGGVGSPSCTPYVCGGTLASCPTSCATDNNCASGNFCNASHQCVAQGAQGATCSANNECQNGKCVDGVCCNSNCDSSCDVCSAALGASHNGVCTILPLGSPGTPSCAPFVCGGKAICPTFCTADSQCQPGDYCDPSGACVPLLSAAHACASNHECSTGFCSDGVCCDEACQGSCARCNLSGHVGTCTALAAGPNEDCLPLHCDGTNESCPAMCLSNSDCATGMACLSGLCTPFKANGSSCASAAECGSGFCVDGVCCSSACEGSCSACGLADHLGTCTLVKGGAAPGRTACVGSGLCGASCDGAHADCQVPGTNTACGPQFCSQAVLTAASFCDGQGACVAGAQSQCGAGCEGDHCAPAPKVPKGGCSSTGPDVAGLLALLLLGLGLTRRSLTKGVV